MGCECESDTGWVCALHGEAPALPVCFHCYVDLDGAACFEAVGELFCSTRCAAAAVSYGHGENCQDGACVDGAALTLPPMLCSLCGYAVATDDTSHPLCRDKLRHAFEGEDDARARFAS